MDREAYGATIAKRRLSRLLFELRRKAGVTGNHVCDRLNWGRGKVGRFEANVWVRPEFSDLRDLARVYDVDDQAWAEIERLAKLARQRAWWRDSEYADVFEGEFPGYEADAARICTWMPLVLPGLLQTEAYIRAHLRIGAKPPEWQERAAAGRLRRQRILDRDDGTAPELVAVITEAALRYEWGSPGDRRDQINHLIKALARPGLELRILRFAGGIHPGMSSLINIFHFPDLDDEPQVYLETDPSITEVPAAETRAYVELFERIRSAADSPGETAAYLRKFAEDLE